MSIQTSTLNLQTHGNTDIQNITEHVEKAVMQSELKCGIVTIFCPSSTSAVTTIEFEPGVIQDLKRLFDEIIPVNKHYEHNTAWGDMNGHAHVRAALMGPSLTIPFTNNRLQLGTWQQIIYIDYDNRPRSRKLILQMIGE